MSVSLFDSFLTTPEMIAVFDDAAIIQAMFRFEEALARAQAAERLIPDSAAHAIAGVCKAQLYDIGALVQAGRRAGSLAIPLVKELMRAVALYDKEAANCVHMGSTSQDVLDTAMVLVTREAIELLEVELDQLIATLFKLANEHADTPMLARTLLQPAQVSSFGFKLCGWAAPLVRARAALRAQAARALALQLGGAVGTLSAMGPHGVAVAARMADDLRLACPPAAWHTQRDEWMRLGLEVAVLTGSVGKIATDLALMSQAEIGELAEPSAMGRGNSSAMPHKRNPVASMVALAAQQRAPQYAATLLSCMGQQHERGLGNWQAELATWPSLFLSAHGALRAMNEAMDGLTVDRQRMRANIDALGGLVYGEALVAHLAGHLGKPAAQALVEALSRETVASGLPLHTAASAAIERDERLHGRINKAQLAALFDPEAPARHAGVAVRSLLPPLRKESTR